MGLGLFTRIAAIPFIFTMLVAIFKVHWPKFSGQGGFEYPLTLAVIALALLYRPELQEPGQHEGIVEVHVAKQRNGPTGEVTLAYVKQFMRFENFAVEHSYAV